jgi:hypothetical protein
VGVSEGQYSNSSVGFVNEDEIKDYIRKQDISYKPFLQYREESYQKIPFN